MSNASKLSAFILLAAGCSVVHAAPVSFTFDEDVWVGTSPVNYVSDDGNYWIRATPWSEYGSAVLKSCAVCGIFVITDGSADNSTAIDGAGPAEAVILELLGVSGGTLLSASFRTIDSNDDFNLYVDGVEVLTDVDPGIGPIATYVFDAEQQYTGTEFRFLADSPENDFKVWQVSFEIAEVPLPGTLGLLGLGLAGLGAIRRRKP